MSLLRSRKPLLIYCLGTSSKARRISPDDYDINGIKVPMIGHNNAFIHACFHLVRHHHQGDLVRIAWLYDLIVLSTNNTLENEDLINLINQMKVNNVVNKALEIVVIYFPHQPIRSLIGRITELDNSPYDYLLTQKNGIHRFFNTIISAGSIKSALYLIKETLIPPREEIENKYGHKKNYLLPFFYIRRALSGTIKWLKK